LKQIARAALSPRCHVFLITRWSTTCS